MSPPFSSDPSSAGGPGSTEVVRYERRGPAAWVTINRPEARNALNRAVREGLFAATARFNADPEAAVLVLTGTGDVAFSAGGDLKEMAADQLRVPPPDFLPQFGRNLHSDKTILAAVNGLAYAGGFLLVQNCDLVLAAEHARFAVTEVRVGRGVPWAAPLTSLLPPKVATQLLLTGEPISAARAYELGLVNEVVPGPELASRAQAWAELIAGHAPLAVRAVKQMVAGTRGLPPEEAYAVAERLFEPVYLSEDAQEGPRAFAEHRPPRWTGR
ncbi:MAG: Enoyl-CoA hydratase/carnithine racemase [Friedmanniella sp.]|nr:Enoyl-CoA hydratase/carnithine racemase [Friedmanniella sp.]